MFPLGTQEQCWCWCWLCGGRRRWGAPCFGEALACHPGHRRDMDDRVVPLAIHLVSSSVRGRWGISVDHEG